jgi:hypothetical protein
VRTALDAMPDTEYDEDGRVVGWRITLRETPHRFTVDGHQLFTWCALDTLMFPAIIGRPAQVSSPSPASGAEVRVEVEPDRIVAVDPPDAVISIVTPGETSSIRGAFCNRVHSSPPPTTPAAGSTTTRTHRCYRSPRPTQWAADWLSRCSPAATTAADRHHTRTTSTRQRAGRWARTFRPSAQ